MQAGGEQRRLLAGLNTRCRGVVCRKWLTWSLRVLYAVGLSACGEASLRFEARGTEGIGTTEDPFSNMTSDQFTPIEVPADGRGTSAAAGVVTLTRVDPASSPAGGGSEARIVGSGFEPGARVFLGDSAVDPALTEVRNGNEIFITVPPGEVGVVDVLVVLPSGEVVRRIAAFTYYGLALTPTEGSTSGGTLVEVTVPEPVSEDVELSFDGASCSDLELITPRRLRCFTPAGEAGVVEVTLHDPADPDRDQAAPDAFEYVEPANSVYGGLSGGPISGSVNVAAYDSETREALEGVRILIGDNPETALTGVTDGRGRVTLAAPGLVGPVTVHAAKDCYERMSIVGFDAQDAALFLNSTAGLECEFIPDAGGGPSVAVAGAFVAGELLFPGTEEFGANAWDIVPRPRANEVRVTYVYATRRTAMSSSIDPGLGGAAPRLVEGQVEAGERGGYPYSIAVRPAGMAVYALAGLERKDTGDFIPYVMGVARDVVAAPGAVVEGVDISMTMPLNREQRVILSKLPSGTHGGPTEFQVRAHLDLGAEGVMVREVGAQRLDVLRSVSNEQAFRFSAQPPLTGILSDARYIVVAGWYSGDSYRDLPYTEAIHVGVPQSEDPLIIDDFLGIPQMQSPLLGALLPEDRVLRWTADGAVPDFYVLEISLLSGLWPLWTQILPGSARSAVLPDMSFFEGHWDFPSGIVSGSLRALRVPGFDYDRFSYSDLSPRTWSHDAVDSFVFQAP